MTKEIGKRGRRWTAILLLAAACLQAGLPPEAHAGADNGAATAVFLRMEQGARPIGMGGAFTAVADDANSLWWNPAGMVRAEYREVQLNHTQFIENITTQFASCIVPLSPEHGALGASFTYFNVPGIEGYTAAKQPTGDLTANALAGSLGYAFYLTSHLSAGANIKMIKQKLADVTGSEMAADFGIQYKNSGFAFGAALQNVGPSLDIDGVENPLPRNLRAGIALYSPKITVSVEGEKAYDADFKPHFGVEWKTAPNFALRAGYQEMKNIGSAAGVSLGVSVQSLLGGGAGGWAEEGTPWWERNMEEAEQDIKSNKLVLMTMDYAFVSYGDFSDTHRISLGFKF
ncbi:MAG: PorV/PorQ family protein [Elusimicrobia bacterium]|nr:PorV/PorQ family protein [Elusimicrobiota bacterium]